MTSSPTASQSPPPPARGRPADRRPREHLLIWTIPALVALALFARHVLQTDQATGAIVAHEDAAYSALVRVLRLAGRHHDTSGRYVDLATLSGHADWPEELVVRRTMEEGRPLDEVWLDGYRIAVLLPARRDPDGAIALTPDGTRADAELAQRHIVVCARPVDPATTGYRIYYGAEGFFKPDGGSIYKSEGVSDDIALWNNRLPRFHQDAGTGRQRDGRSWSDVGGRIDYR